MANQATAARSKIGKPGATRKVAGGLALFIILLVVVAVIRSGALSTKSGSEAHHETGGLSSSEPTHNNVVVTETAPAPGNGHMPSAQAGGYGAPIAIPLGWQLRTIADNGSGSYRWQFHLRGASADEWIDAPDSRSDQADQVRHKSNGAEQDFAYYFVREQ